MKILRLKNNIIFFIIISLVFVGCQRKKEHLSDRFDLKHDKIAESYYPAYSSTIVQNDQFVFYESEKQEIIRINKKDNKKTTIIRLENKSEEENEGGLELTKESLYYVHDRSVFKSDLNGKNIKRLISAKNQKEIECIDGIKIHNDKIYLLAEDDGSEDVFRFYPKSRNLEKVAEDVSNPCFYKNSLYYTEHGEVGIHKVNLETLKDKIVRGQAWKNELKYEDDIVRYIGIMENQGKIYYICWGKNDKMRLYQYRGPKKDTIKHGFSDNAYDFVYNSSVIVGFNTHWDSPDERYIQIYNLDSEKEKKMKMPNESWYAELVVDDLIFCSYPDDKGESLSMLKIR